MEQMEEEVDKLLGLIEDTIVPAAFELGSPGFRGNWEGMNIVHLVEELFLGEGHGRNQTWPVMKQTLVPLR